MHLEHSRSDILKGCPRSVLTTEGEALFYALSVDNLDLFLSGFDKWFGSDWVDCLAKIRPEQLKRWFLSKLSIYYKKIECYTLIQFKKQEIIDTYGLLQAKPCKALIVNSLELLLIIFEQNNILQIARNLAKITKDTQETYDNNYIDCTILDQVSKYYNMYPGLNLLNINDILSPEQKTLFFSLAEQKNKKEIENHYISLSLGLSNAFVEENKRTDLYKFLFPEKEPLNPVESDDPWLPVRKNYLGDRFTGDTEKDDLLIYEQAKNKKEVLSWLMPPDRSNKLLAMMEGSTKN